MFSVCYVLLGTGNVEVNKQRRSIRYVLTGASHGDLAACV
jgi:hypothetical protein